MEKLRKTTLKYLEQQLEDYQTIDDEIARMRIRVTAIDPKFVPFMEEVEDDEVEEDDEI
ncbi:hypothetical protein [Companilactobacillus ginsenosidimutans]|uniref:hypothetical protein n=1 Tax=Companilactobacillus ginsenosidimutans TaxID=1007676 RepID=UPI000A3F5328|nr:hypothetical protein [Companilactobacillus ginsenosidimutans]